MQAPFSDAVLVGNTLDLAGRIGIPSEDRRAASHFDREIRLLLDGMKETLHAAGMTMDHLVSVQVFCPDLTLYDRFNKVYSSYFNKNFPATSIHRIGPAASRGALRDVSYRDQGLTGRTWDTPGR